MGTQLDAVIGTLTHRSHPSDRRDDLPGTGIQPGLEPRLRLGGVRSEGPRQCDDRAEAGQTTATGKLQIKRLDFEVGDAEWKGTSIVADPMDVTLRIVLTGIDPL